MKMTRARCIALTGLALLGITGCRQSRIGDAETVDVCGLVTALESDRILGPRTADPKSLSEGGFAGGCSWSFRAGGDPASVSAYVMTRHSAENLLTTPKDWFDNPVRLADARTNLGEPSNIKGLGYVALLYDGRTLDVRKGETVIIVHTDHGEVAQMEKLAQTLLSPR